MVLDCIGELVERSMTPSLYLGVGAETPTAGSNPALSAIHKGANNMDNLEKFLAFVKSQSEFHTRLENHLHMLSLYFVHYNFVRIHKTLKVTPAMEAGVSNELHDMEWIVGLIDENTPEPKKRGPYKKQISK